MSGIEILHIAQDEKFVNGAYYLFEQAFPGSNTFVIVKPPADPPIRFLGKRLVNDARFEVNSKDSAERLVKLGAHYSIIVLHGLNKFTAAVFSSSPYKDRFICIVLGAEIYNGGLLENELMGEKTKKLYRHTNRYTFYDRLKDVYRSVKYRHHEYLPEIAPEEILYQMKVFGSLPGMNYEKNINQKLYNPFVQRVPFTYYPIEYITKNKLLRASGSDILLGNSASATNNHLEAFDLLRRFNLGDKKIVAPLSYGSPRYAKAIINEGNEQFGDRFVPLTSFLPLEEYNQLMSSCGIVVMNHYRPQALGNIISALYMGCKVFLNNTSIYQYFNNLGCHIYSIEKDLIATEKALQLLSDEEVTHNRTILKNYLGTSVLVDGMREAVDKIFDSKATNRKREKIL